MPHTVLYDHQTFQEQTYGGISRYFFELMRRFSGQQAWEMSCSLLFSKNEYYNKASMPAHFPAVLPARRLTSRNKFFPWANAENSKRKLKAGKYDIFHPTYYDPYFLQHIGSRPFVATFHDMTHELFAQQYPALAEQQSLLEGKKILAQKAPHIIAVSEHTKKDLIEIMDVPAERISVVHLGHSMQMQPSPTSLLQHPYLLFVGGRWSYKNFPFLLEATAPMLRENPDLLLVCAGSSPFDQEEMALIKRLGIQQQVRHIPYQDDQQLTDLYAHAECFIFPSLYEGFGIPVLEAFHCGCPALLSNNSSLPEVGAEAAQYFSPTAHQELLDGLQNIVGQRTKREAMVQAGRQRAQLFSWDKTFSETLDVYQYLLD